MKQQLILMVIAGILLTVSIESRPSTHIARAWHTETATSFELGPEALVSVNEDGGALRCEPSVAIFKDTIVAAWNDSYGGTHGISRSKTGVAVGWSISRDRGKSFKFGGYLPQNQSGGILSGVDSWLAADSKGNFYLQVVSWETPREIQLYYMDHQNLGRWQRMSNADSGDDLDKAAMSVDSGGRIGIAYNSGTSSIHFTLSDDKGKNWSKPVKLSTPSTKVRLGASVAMTGKRVVVGWAEGLGIDLNEIWWTQSEDGGESFAPPNMLFKNRERLQAPKGYAMGYGYPSVIMNLPSLACGISGSGSVTFYLACLEVVAKGSRVLLFALPSNERTWSQPVQVGKSPDTAIKVMPFIATAGSKPAVLYYDRRNNLDESLTDVYLSLFKEGAKFEDIKLNTISTDWEKTPGDKEYAPIQRNFGDYITLASSSSLLVAAWTDGRSGVPRVYARAIEIR